MAAAETASPLDLCSEYSESFNLQLGIASIFIVAAISAGGFLLPSFAGKRKDASSTEFAITVASAAGTGVLICVAIVHILADAQEDLSHPCLPEGFTAAFPNWACLISAVTIMLMVILDYLTQGYFERKFLRDDVQQPGQPSGPGLTDNSATTIIKSDVESQQDLSLCKCKDGLTLKNSCCSHQPAAVTESSATPHCHQQQQQQQQTAHGSIDGHSHGTLPPGASLAMKRGVVIFVEWSVCTHSIPVGLSLGLQGDDTFITLFIAILVHQLLEGLGVGAAAAEGKFSTPKLLALASGFALTAPIGIALGVALHHSLNQSDPRYLMALGIVNAMASGMLLYVAIEHMNALSNKGSWLRRQVAWKQACVMAAFIVGGVAMIVVGKWA